MRISQILLAILLTVLPICLFATDYYIAKAELNVRAGAGTEYSVLFTLQKGDEVEVLSKENKWYLIKYMGKTGYTHSKYLSYARTTPDVRLQDAQQTVSHILITAYSILALFVVFIIYGKIRDKILLSRVTDTTRGTKSERNLALKLLKNGLPKKNIFHDLYVEKRKGEFSQIDLVVLSNVGIIVFEVKDYSGWIFGNGSQSQWTKVLAYGKQKYTFYNPIKQNNKHIDELRKQLYQFGNIPFYSIVVFYGECVLKNINFVPSGTFIVKSKRVIEVVRSILQTNEPVFYTNENEIIRILRQAVVNGGIRENQIQHSANMTDMLGIHRIFD